MAGLTQSENVKKALLLLDEASKCIDLALLEAEVGYLRTFPYPETRHNVRSLRRVRRELENNWNTLWRCK